jgi:hypothetical protein
MTREVSEDMNASKKKISLAAARRALARLGRVAMVAALIVAVPASSYAAPAGSADKKIAKLEKKVEKAQAAIALKQQKILDTQAEKVIKAAEKVQGEADLVTAQALPQTTKAETKLAKKAIKAANKVINKAAKRLTKLDKKILKLQAKIIKHVAKIANLQLKIEGLTVGGVPDPGAQGVAALDLPERMNVIVASDNAGTTSSSGPVNDGPAPSLLVGDSYPASSDFVTDQSQTWVYDPSMESLESVNSILCMLRQSAYDQLVNQGPYLAQINPGLCGEGANGTNGQQGEVEEQELWTVTSVRADGNSVHVVAVWVPQEAGDGPDGSDEAATIHARMEITESESLENPYGVFHLDFVGITDGDASHTPVMYGTLSTQDAATGTLGFSFFETTANPQDEFQFERAVHVNLDSEGVGVAHVSESTTGPFGQGGATITEEGEYLLAFNEANLLRGTNLTDGVCLNRTEFDTNVWNYNLYHATGDDAGERVVQNSGFGIETASGDYGWVGYYGSWLPDDELQDGAVVTKNSYGVGDNPVQYTVLQAPGKLYRNTQNTLALADIDGQSFEFWDEDSLGGYSQFLVVYDHTSGQFSKISEQQGDNWVPLNPPVVIDTAALGWLGLWSSSLGGSVIYVEGENEITYFQEELVDPSDGAFAGEDGLTLYTFVEALDSGILGSEATNGDVFLPTVEDLQTPYTFEFLFDDLTLYRDVSIMGDGSQLTQVGLANGETYSSGPFDWGMRSGPMVTDLGSVSDVYDLWAQDVFYVYETGPNSWNRHTTLVDSLGDVVSFDPPLQFTYQHSLVNDLNRDATYDGDVFQLEYNGTGELGGMPYYGVDLDGDGSEDRWYPVFSIEDGTLMGPTGTEYVLRAMQMEQQLSADATGCDGMTLNGADQLALPDGSDFEDPNIGDKPVITDAPAVVEGELQQ